MVKVQLKRSKDFERVFFLGRYFFCSSVSLKVFNREDGMPSRVGFAIGKKQYSTIVKRNFLKRRLKSAFFPIIHKLLTGFDIVVLPGNKTTTETIGTMTKDAETLLKKHGIIPKK